MGDDEQMERRGARRRLLSTEVEFYVDADIVLASSLDISASGVRLCTDRPIRICMRMEIDGELSEREAELVWARRTDDGKMDYGFEYLEEADEVLLGPDTTL